jgi:hypothetical protein
MMMRLSSVWVMMMHACGVLDIFIVLHFISTDKTYLPKCLLELLYECSLLSQVVIFGQKPSDYDLHGMNDI